MSDFTMPVWRPARPGGKLARAKALAGIQAALAVAPDRIDLQRRQAQLLVDLDRLAEVIAWLGPLAEGRDADPDLLYWLGLAAQRRDPPLAAKALRMAVDAGLKNALDPLAAALTRLGRAEEALAAALSALDHDPSNFNALGIAACCLDEQGALSRIPALCRDLWARGGRTSQILATEAVGHALTGDRDARDRLADPDSWIAIEALPVDAAFNARLVAELEAGRALDGLPSTKTTRGEGRRFDHIDAHRGATIQELMSHARAGVERYARARAHLAGHPMIADRPSAIDLDSWALRVGHDGHEDWHIHPAGWISGVYYVEVPAPDRLASPAGAIGFGPLPLGAIRDDLAWPRRTILPAAGQLLLFPSHFAHRTWPTGIDTTRTVIAFDVVRRLTPSENEPAA